MRSMLGVLTGVWLGALPFGVLALGLMVSHPARAQVVGATLSGTVTDPSNAVIPNADIVIEDSGTGVTRTVTTDSDGVYTAPNLVPGTYSVTGKAQGFKTYVRSGITLTVGAQQALNITMQVGQVSQEVNVTSAAPQIELTSSTLGDVLTSNTAVEMPLNGRDWTSLAALEPGVNSMAAIQTATIGTATKANRGFGLQLTIAGVRPQLNNYRIDGISVVDATGGAPGSIMGQALGVDAVGEFSVLTADYSAAYGRTAGGIINAITKTGTNAFHGDAYEFLRNQIFDSRVFPTPAGPVPPYRRNQFGASLGGPIQKNKTFAFVDYEGVRQNQGTTEILNVPTQSAENGTIYSSNGTPTKITVSSLVKPFFPLWPQPVTILSPGNVGQVDTTVRTTSSENYVTSRIDRTFSAQDSVFGTFFYDSATSEQPDSLNNWVFGNTSGRDFVALEETHIFRPDLVNSVRVGFNRSNPYAGQPLKDVNPLAESTALGTFPGRYASSCCGSGTGLTGFTGYGADAAFHYVFNSYQAYDDAFWTRGTNSIKFGFAFERMQTNATLFNFPNGSWTFGSLTSFLEDEPATFQGSEPSGIAEIGGRQTLFGGYLQDDWQIRKNLTLNLGVRYEMVTVPTAVNNELSNLPTATATAPHLGSPYFSNPTERDFEPRLGFVWDPFRTGKTSVRGAFGLFDVLPMNYFFFWGEDRAAPFNIELVNSSMPAGAFPTEGPILAGTSPTALTYNYIPSNPPSSYMEIWNLSIQRQLTSNLSMTVGYVGSHGVHNIERSDDINAVQPTPTQYGNLWPIPGTGTKLNPALGQIVGMWWTGSSTYDGLSVQATERMSHGFYINASYTWSRSYDGGSSSTLSDNFINSLQNLAPYNTKFNYGPSDFDIPQTVAISYIWDIPNAKFGGASHLANRLVDGWELGGIITINSGEPFTPLIAGDPLGTREQDPSDFPSLSGASGCNTLTNPRNSKDYLKLNCWAVPSAPALGTQCAAFSTVPGSCVNLQGNEGRNVVWGPGLETWDMSLDKNNYIPRISEAFNLQFRMEAFNALNRTNLSFPGAGQPDLFDANGASVPSAGQITAAATNARQIQFALKAIF